MAQIPLTQGKYAIVDDDLYEYLSQWKWFYNNGYAGRHIGRYGTRRLVSMHRFIMETPDELEVDHINHNTLDNRRQNLRNVTRAFNQANKSVQKNNKLGLKGVYIDKITGKYKAHIRVNKIKKYIGCYETAEEAARAYDKAALEFYGEHALTNFKY